MSGRVVYEICHKIFTLNPVQSTISRRLKNKIWWKKSDEQDSH